MLYDDSQSKKRTASHLTDQRQQITTLKSATGPVPLSSHMGSSSSSPNQQVYANGGDDTDGPQPNSNSKRFRAERSHSITQLQSTSTAPATTTNSSPVQYGNNNHPYSDHSNGDHMNAAAYSVSTASAISSSLNSVYDTNETESNGDVIVINDTVTSYVTYDLDESGVSEHNEPASYMLNSTIVLSDTEDDLNVEGVKIPPEFCTYAINHGEPWMGALFLDEPDANKLCKYPRHLVYPNYPDGGGVEFSLEEIRYVCN